MAFTPTLSTGADQGVFGEVQPSARFVYFDMVRHASCKVLVEKVGLARTSELRSIHISPCRSYPGVD